MIKTCQRMKYSLCLISVSDDENGKIVKGDELFEGERNQKVGKEKGVDSTDTKIRRKGRKSGAKLMRGGEK